MTTTTPATLVPAAPVFANRRVLQRVHRSGRLARAEHRTAQPQEQTAWTPP